MFKHILVPVDGTPLADRSIEQALALARVHAAQIHFLHVQPDVAATADGALLLALSPGLLADGAHGRPGLVLARAEAAARLAGVPCHCLAVVHEQPALAILAAAGTQGCDLVFMASHGRRGLSGRGLGRVTRAVLDAARLPVLVAAVEINQPLDARARALGVLRAEHRSLAAVIQALQQHWARVQAGAAPDLPLLRAMLFYLAQFPERRHHPKEDTQLFARLRQRTDSCNALLDRLQAQHRQGTQQFAALQALLAALQAGQPDAAAQFGAALARFAEDQAQHRRCEEQFVLPAAAQWLHDDDWQAIAAAFEANGDPQFEPGGDQAFEQLAERLLSLAGATRTTPTETR
ncbi:universal stress protein [Aquabacterium sp. OR-4]|uniref:universal stress protein n=1 Tax=Aquabacterium sp. OR-4 TaxID=2978127 RepID=UPI0028C8D09E|nr:universal stress protein [Aquabacterium sp. OR-4]MDT7838982.1 universal stress protein [Aquabacterium sp. OR-4]